MLIRAAMTRVCAWCGKAEGSGVAAASGGAVTHEMCGLCAIQQFVFDLVMKGARRLRGLAHR